MATGKLELGAPILDSSSGGNKVVTDGVVVKVGYAPIIITPTATNRNQQTSQNTIVINN